MSTMRPIFFEREFVRLCLLLTVLYTCGSGARTRRKLTLKDCGRRLAPSARIVGGNFVQPGDYPWMVTIHEYDEGFEHVCGGAVLNDHWIITAAHCISNPSKPNRYLIYTGLRTLSKKDYRKGRYKISKVIVHEEYDSDTFHNDIALLKTKKPIVFKKSREFVNGVCLPSTEKDPTGWATITGWGHTLEDGEMSDILRAVTIPIVPREKCREAYDDDLEDDYEEIFDSMICAGEENKDSCQYDSGGPLVQTDKRGVYTLIGIVSFGVGCGDEGMPGVYTKVSSYIDWLQKNVY